MRHIILIVFAFIPIGLSPQFEFSKGAQGQLGNEAPKQNAVATFAGGCFWCVEADFEKIDGVIEAISGYAGGNEPNPTYKEVSAGKTGHVEAVQVFFNPSSVSYSFLLETFWKHVDPTDPGGQFVDRGPHYRSIIFYHDREQKRLAQQSMEHLGSSGIFKEKIITEIKPLKKFYKAEEYHQNYDQYEPRQGGNGRDALQEPVLDDYVDGWPKNGPQRYDQVIDDQEGDHQGNEHEKTPAQALPHVAFDSLEGGARVFWIPIFVLSIHDQSPAALSQVSRNRVE